MITVGDVSWELVMMVTSILIGVYVGLRLVSSLMGRGTVLSGSQMFFTIVGSMLLLAAFLLWMELELLVLWIALFGILLIVLIILTESESLSKGVKRVLFGRGT